MSDSIKVIANNKRASFEYFIEDKYEAGIVLDGCEVKSVRAGKININDSYAVIKGNEIFLIGSHIAQYDKGSYNNKDSTRTRKLLLHKYEINRLRGKTEAKGYTLVPLKVYFKDALIKVEIGLCMGKKLYDKRRSIKDKEERRKIQRVFKENDIK